MSPHPQVPSLGARVAVSLADGCAHRSPRPRVASARSESHIPSHALVVRYAAEVPAYWESACITVHSRDWGRWYDAGPGFWLVAAYDEQTEALLREGRSVENVVQAMRDEHYFGGFCPKALQRDRDAVDTLAAKLQRRRGGKVVGLRGGHGTVPAGWYVLSTDRAFVIGCERWGKGWLDARGTDALRYDLAVQLALFGEERYA